MKRLRQSLATVFILASSTLVVVVFHDGEGTDQHLAPEASPKEIVLGKTTHLDLSDVILQPPEAVVEVQVHNPENYPITVTRIEPSCGCASAELLPRTIDAGGQSVLKIGLNASVAGNKTLAFVLNTEAESVYRFRLHGNYIRNFIWEPAQLLFPDVKADSDLEAEVLLTVVGDTDLEELKIETTPNQHTQVTNVAAAGSRQVGQTILSQYRVTVAFQGNSADLKSGVAELLAVSGAESSRSIIRWVVQPTFDVIPKEVGFVGTLPGVRQIVLRSRQGQEFSVNEVEPDDSWVTCSAVTEGSATLHRLRLELADGEIAPGPVSTTLRIRTNHPEAELVKVPVKWLH